MTLEKYKEKVFNFTEKDFWKELKRICKEIDFDPKLMFMWKATCGPSYAIEKVAEEIYFSDRKISQPIRNKLKILYKAAEIHSLFYLNTQIKHTKGWEQERYMKQREELLKKP